MTFSPSAKVSVFMVLWGEALYRIKVYCVIKLERGNNILNKFHSISLPVNSNDDTLGACLSNGILAICLRSTLPSTARQTRCNEKKLMVHVSSKPLKQ
jgi:hypothetical protein